MRKSKPLLLLHAANEETRKHTLSKLDELDHDDDSRKVVRQFKLHLKFCHTLDNVPFNQYGRRILYTENEKTSGLCPSCYKKDNSAIYHLGINSRGELIYVNAENGDEESAILTPEQIKNHEKLLYPNVTCSLVPCGSNPFGDAKELLFVGQDSEYGKAIHNVSVRKNIAKMTAFEEWKKTYPEQLLELLSWEEETVSEERFNKMYPTVSSAFGKKITSTF